MDVVFVAEDEVRTPVLAGLTALGLEPTEVDIESVDGHAMPIVAAPAGDPLLTQAGDRLDGLWIGIEVGGMGGWQLPKTEACVTVFDAAGGPCHRCLRTRIDAAHKELTEASGGYDASSASYAGAQAAWMLRDVGADQLDQLRGRLIEIGGMTRRLLAVPGCDCELAADRFELEFAHVEYELDDALERAEQAFDDRLGIITEVGEQASFPTPYYLARLADTAGFSDRTAAKLAAGVDHDWNGSFMRALGEGLERYCAGVYHVDDLPTEPGDRCIELGSLALARGDDRPIGHWWRGVDLHEQTSVSLPAESVVFPPPDDADLAGITTGLGLGSSTVAATLQGLLEVIERDACMLGWYSTFEPMALHVDSEGYRTIERRIASEGLGATSMLVTQDIDVPVVTSVVHRRDGEGDSMVTVPWSDGDDWPAFAVGSAASFDPAKAAERALAEATQNWMELRSMGPDRAESEGAIARFASFPREARGFLDIEHEVPVTSVGPAEIPEGETALDRAIQAVSEIALDAYVARLTTPDVADLGFEVVRVIVPQAQPLVRQATPMSQRVKTVPRSLGFRPRLDRGPHPYP